MNLNGLRPEYQNPQGTKAATQVSLANLEAAVPVKAAKYEKAAKLPWPKDLAELGEATAEDVPRRFKEVQAEQEGGGREWCGGAWVPVGVEAVREGRLRVQPSAGRAGRPAVSIRSTRFRRQ